MAVNGFPPSGLQMAGRSIKGILDPLPRVLLPRSFLSPWVVTMLEGLLARLGACCCASASQDLTRFDAVADPEASPRQSLKTRFADRPGHGQETSRPVPYWASPPSRTRTISVH